MDSDVRKRKSHPKDTAGISSLLTFSYIFPYIRRGNHKDLNENDICKAWTKLVSTKIGDKVERLWKQQKVKPGNKKSVVKLLCDCFLKRYLLLGVLQLVVKLFYITSTPYSVGKLVNYFKENQENITKQEAWTYAGIIIFANTAFLFYEQHYLLLRSELGMEIVTSLSSLVYRKTLKLSAKKIQEISTGKIVTAITKDIVQMELIVHVLNDLWVEMIQAAVVIYLLYIKLGVSGLTGLTIIVFLVILQVYISTGMFKKRQEVNNKSDERVQITQECITTVKILKMYVWEKFFNKKIIHARKTEIQKLRKLIILKWFTAFLGNLSNKLSLFFVIMCYIWFGHTLSAEIFYFVATCFHNLRRTLVYIIPAFIICSAECLSCIRRLEIILTAEEIEQNIHKSSIIIPRVEFCSASTAIGNIKILDDVNIKLKSGLNILCGPVGSGKSSLLKGILGEHKTITGKKNIDGSISYCPQNPWIFPSSIKQNILFGHPYNEAKYKEILEICDLQFDLEILKIGDETILNDCGVNLSKGQQTRVNMARALYKDSDIYIFDDSLSSLDRHVSNHVFNRAIRNYLKNKIVILSTHEKVLFNKADNLIMMLNRTVIYSGNPKDVLFKLPQNDDHSFDTIDETDKNYFHMNGTVLEEELCSEDTELISKIDKSFKANIYHENIRSGGIGFGDYRKYFSFSGGIYSFFMIVGLFIFIEFFSGYSEKLLSNWVSFEEGVSTSTNRIPSSAIDNFTSSPRRYQGIYKNSEFFTDSSENSSLKQNLTVLNSVIDESRDYLVQRYTYISIYSVLIISSCFLMFLSSSLFCVFSLKIAKNLHKSMVSKILGAKMSFFDINMSGNILNRFSKDIYIVDEWVPFVMSQALIMITMLTTSVVLIASINWSFIVITLILLSIFYFACYYCITPARTLQRLSMASRSPVIGHLNATLEGLITIRAFETQSTFVDEFDKHQDLMVASNHLFEILIRGLAFFLHMISAVYTAVIIIMFLIIEGDSSSNVGLAITQSFVLSRFLDWSIQQWVLLESMMTNFQRAFEYTDVEQERQTGQIIRNWPSEGCIEYKNVNLTYTVDNGPVLKNLNFEIKSRERIAIVGRTGSGKSSIAATLFRLYEVDGDIFIDNINIKTLSSDFLRNSIGIIPQDPILFSGSVRSNIDPLNKCSDSEIWKALHDVNLGSFIEKLDENIQKNASTFSVGQKQLFCLARAIVRKVKIVILDEVTAFVDEESAQMIQNKILEVFDNCTIISITHNLHSVMSYNKILVIHKGMAIEFDTPSVLLEKKGAFYRMVQQMKMRSPGKSTL